MAGDGDGDGGGPAQKCGISSKLRKTKMLAACVCATPVTKRDTLCHF